METHDRDCPRFQDRLERAGSESKKILTPVLLIARSKSALTEKKEEAEHEKEF